MSNRSSIVYFSYVDSNSESSTFLEEKQRSSRVKKTKRMCIELK